MRYNVADEKFILRNTQFERYCIDIIKNGVATKDDTEAIRLRRIVSKLPQRYGKVLKNPENYIDRITMDDKLLLLSLFNCYFIPMILNEKSIPAISEGAETEHRFTPALKKMLLGLKDNNDWSNSFILSTERIQRYFFLISNVQNSSIYLSNHDWKNTKKNNRQNILDESFRKIKMLVNAINSFEREKKTIKRLVGLSVLEARILMHIGVNENMTLSQYDLAHFFLGVPSSRYIKMATNALCSKGYIVPQKVAARLKSKALYTITSDGWKAVTSIMDTIFNFQ